MPVDTYKIQLEPIRSADVDVSAKKLALEIAQLNNRVGALKKALEKSASIQEKAEKTGGADPKAIRVNIETSKKLDAAAKQLSQAVKYLTNTFKELPKVINDAVAKASETARGVRTDPGRAVSLDPQVRDLTRELVKLRKNVGLSATYQTKKEDVTGAIDKLIRELSVQRRDITKLADSVRGLYKAVGKPEAPKAGEFKKPSYTPTADVKLFGKVLKDMGGEFEKIKKELADKIVVSVDLETSAAKFGKDAAANFITQIAYQKGTLADIMSGAAEKKSIYVKPPAKTESEYLKKLVTPPPGRAPLTKEESSELKKIAVPFKKFSEKNAKEVNEALQDLANTLKDSEAIIGHNIADFDVRILQQHFDKAGIKIDAAVDKFIDTWKLAQKNFPERYGAHKEFTKLKPQRLERFEKDLKLAGVQIDSMGGRAHDAAYDLDITAKLLKALDKSTKELAAAESNVSAMLDKLLSDMAGATQDAAKKIKFAGEKASAAAEDYSTLGIEAKKFSKVLAKQVVNVEDIASVKSALQTRVYGTTTLRPRAEAGRYDVQGTGAAGVSEKVLNIWGDLAKSLYDLQKNMVMSLEKGMNKGLAIWKDASGEAFRLGEGGREWEVRIADVRGLRRELASTFREQATPGATPGQLVKAFKEAFVRREMSTMVSREDMALEVYKEIGSLNKETLKKVGSIVEGLYKDIQNKTVTDKDILDRPDLTTLYKEVALEAQAERSVMEKFVKSITLPAAQVTPQGTLAFETKYGAEKAVSNFATITTGFEKMVGELEKLGAPAIELARYMQDVAKAPLRPAPGTAGEKQAEQLAETLQKRILQLGGRDILKQGYSRAVAFRETERGKSGMEVLRDTEIMSLGELIKKAKELNVTALDAAKALDEISFENFYDILNKMFQAGKTPFLESQAGSIIKLGQSERSLRKIGSVINDVMGLLPMIEPGKPKRREYDEQSLRVLTKAMGELRPEEQKQHIIDVGMLWKDLTVRAEKLEQGLFTGKEYLGRPVASSLDLSDAASSALKQFNLNMASNLKALDKTMTSMSLSNIRALAPFQQYASIQRQMSYATSAIGGGLSKEQGFTTPSLMSKRERGLIESGRYGAGGYGLDVLTELRNTASTFEDQIMISGRLAKAFTEITGRLVRPAATYLEQQRITEVSGGVQRMTPRAARMRSESEGEYKRILGDVSEQFQEILGVPEKYRGRADIAEISDKIEKVMREHRGRTIEVQTAKLTETFLNYFGRKFSTRFGTKGVSVTPRYGELPKDITGIEDVSKFIQAGFKTGVTPGPGLGAAKVPKSVGQLLSEIIEEEAPKLRGLFDKDVLEFLQDQLEKSGNKFIIDLFTDASKGLVTEEEAKKQRAIFQGVTQLFEKGFGRAKFPTGVAGIKEIQELYKTTLPEEEITEFKPIEARISSRGIAKRGLMPELLEGIVNNLIGTTGDVTTLVDKVGKDALTETKEARMRLNEYLEALGFEAFKDVDKVIEGLKLPEVEAGEAKKWESQWKVYTDVVDEFGKQMQSFVAPKFLQIIEEPHRYKEWTPEEIEKGVKGARLDFQSFAAMAGVFGEGSSMMKELASSTSLAAKEGWELMRAFQMLDPSMKELKESVMKTLPTVKLEEVKGFEDATGTVEDFKDTLFDIGKYPTPFKLRVPGAKGAYEELPVPGAALRGTYREQLLGRGAPTNIARYLANLVNSAKAVEDLTAAASRGGVGLSEDIQRKFAGTIRKELTTSLTDAIKQFRGYEESGALTPQNIEFMQTTIEGFKKGLSAERVAPGIYQEGASRTELEAVEAFESKAKGPFKYSTILGRISDILIGADPASLQREMERELMPALKSFEESGVVPEKFKGRSPEGFKRTIDAYIKRNIARGEAAKAFDVELEAGNLDEFAQKVGIDVSESVKEALEQKLESLSRAKISYFRELGAEVFGKKKGIEQVFFQRVTPAVTGKAVSAITDKTKELGDLLDVLSGAKYDLELDIPGINDLIKDVRTLNEEHKKYVEKAKKLGLPVLREGEIAIPEAQASKIKVRTGKEGEVESNLAELIKKQEKVFVESIRFPFTGTLSVQPAMAKLMEDMGLNLGKQAIAVPGAPQLDLEKLNNIIGTLKEYVGIAPRKELGDETLTLLEQREKAWAEGTEQGAEKAQALTNTIEGLLKVINDATPKFTNLEQKLDFDGDALFVHTGQLEESRKEIAEHYRALGNEVTSVRNLFRSLFTAVDEGDVSTLLEMRQVFEKKHPREKGFEFLTKPYIAEEMKGLALEDVMGGLFKYTKGAEGLKKGTDEWQKAVADWSKGFVADEILPEVFTKLGVQGPEREAYMSKLPGAKAGIPEETTASNELERRIGQLSEELVRRQLWEKRYADAITGQLYKLHTGQTVEGISRIARVSEMETGFGSGLAGTGKGAQPSAEFLSAFPKESIALGGRPVQEFATRVNEIMRFVIQKGMDVKHAGVEAVGTKIIANIGKTSGAEMIMKSMEEFKDQFEELADFNDQIANEVKLRLGAVSTDELKRELKRFEPDIDVEDLNIDRAAIMERIIKHVNLEAVFEELFRQIRRQAVKGLAKQLTEQAATLPPGTKRMNLMRDIEAAGGAERLAAEKIDKEAAEKGGISAFKYITTTLQPLYKMRTSMETMATAATRSGLKIDTSEVGLPGGEAGKDLARQYETAAKAANALTKAMESSAGAPGRGIYSSMVVGALEQRYKDLEELQKLDQDAQKHAGRFEYAFTEVMDANKLAAKVWTESKELAGVKAPTLMPADYDVTGWLDQMNQVKKIAARKLEEISEKAGLPPMVPEEKQLLATEFETKYGGRSFKAIKDVISKGMIAREEKIVPEDLERKATDAYEKVLDFVKFQISFVEQLRRVSEIVKTVPAQKMYLAGAFPDFDPTKELKPSFEKVRDSSKEFFDKEKAVTELLDQYYKEQTATSLGDVQKSIKAMAEPAGASAAAEDLKKGALKAADEITEVIDKTVVQRKRDVLKYLESKAEGAKPGRGAFGVTQKPLFDVFRASGVHAGGMYGGGAQQEAIMREMLGVRDPSMLLEATAFRGQAIHRKVQKEFVEKYPGAQIEQPMEDFENKITGHFDVLYEKAGQKMLTDIKTVYSTAQFDRLEQIANEIGERGITIQQKLDELKASEPTSTVEKNVIRRLEDYISQVNVYLKNTEDAVGEILVVSTFDPAQRFTIPVGKFDPSRFDKDIAAVNESRSKVMEILKSISTTGGLPDDLLKEYPKLYKDLSKRVEQLGVKGFKETIPVRPIGEVGRPTEEILGRLTEAQQEQFERVSREYLDVFKELGGPGRAEKYYKLWFESGAGAAGAPPAAPPPSPPTGPGGGGFDDDDEFRKKIEELLSKLRRGVEPDVGEMTRLIRALYESEDRAASAFQNNNEQLGKALEDLVKRIREVIEMYGGMKHFERVAELYGELDKIKVTGEAGGAKDFGKFRTADIERVQPDRPEAIHKNLQALYEAAIRVNRLADSEEIQKFGPEIAKLLMETAEKGPAGISPQISEAIANLPPEKKGGMARIWMQYKKAVSEYFLKRLDDLKQEIDKEGSSPEGRKAYMEYEQVLEKYLANIRGTVGRMSDIFTTQGPTGRKTQFVDPELARLTGIYKTPKQIEEVVKQGSMLSGEFKPIMDVLVGDLDPTLLDDMVKPIEKVRTAFQMLTKEDSGMRAILEDADAFRRIGNQAVKAWDFDKLVRGITQLRGGLQAYNRLQIGGFGGLGEDYTEQVRKNVEDTINYLKQLEKMFAPIGAEASPMGTVGVPPFLDPKTQELIHKRNISQIQKYFAQPEAAGGPERGEAFTYRYKIVDPASKQVLMSMAEEFKKIGEETNKAGKEVGIFTQRTEDLIKSFQGRRGIGQAFGRVIRWGFASRTVYGMISAMQSMVNTIADVESGIAVLRQVMSPLQTNFEQITMSALDFAKQFGLPIRQVIDSMRVFAQQGLAQQEVVDRTRTSMLAANVTTLSTTEATEAITAAMKVYGKEGQSTIQFLDAWTEVEARHAITSADLANALKKAAAVAKTSGVSFDQLNAIITGIGETTRQTGKEIGTSLRFMFRRVQAEKAPKELAQIGIPVVGESGELRSTFDILDDLAKAWTTMTNAHRLNIATAIGGRRHYNSLLVLMDHWDDVLETLGHSLNSKGAAERRNMIVMETYAKKLQQVRGALAELQVQFGKFALPVAKTLLTGLKGVLEVIANIPPGLKMAALGFSALFVIVAKGQNLISGVIDRMKGFTSSFGDLGSQFMKQFKIGIFETFGKLPKALADIDVRGLSSIDQAGKGIQDFESVLGKAAFALAQFGRGWNSVMSEIAYTGTATSETVSKAFGKIAGGLGTGAIKAATKMPALAAILGVMSKGAQSGEVGFQKLGEMLGIPAVALAKWSQENTSFVKSVAPLAGSIAALIPVAGKAGDELKKLAFSADNYEKSLDPLERKLTSELATINELSSVYKKLKENIKTATESAEPEAAAKAIEREEYVSPLLTMGKTYDDARKFANQLAKTNMSMIQGFDELGNAVLKTTTNFEDYFRVLRAAKLKELADTGVSALEKYAEELTNAGTMGSKFRSELKKFVGEIPALGPLLAKSIAVSPAQELEEATEIVNKILTAREQFPMTTAFDELFQRYLGDLEKVKDRYNEFYGDFRRVLADLPTEGLSAAQIKDILDKETLQPAFELMIEFEGRLKNLSKAGKIDWRDILGTEILKRIRPGVSLDYAAPLTKEMLRQNKIVQREGEAFAGDIVLFTDAIDKEFDVAGRQGILKYREGLGYFVEGIDRELRNVKEIPFDTVRNFVDSVFPAHRIADQMQENIDILRESLIGAAAGMVGIADKEFRRVYGLGPRFFEQIPTETLIQTPMGFGGGTRAFGAQPFKAGLGGLGFEKIVKDYFVKPIKELEQLVEEPKKRLDAERGFIRGLEEEVERYGTIIKNNQVVVQYMGLFVDLNKSLAESSRILEENIVAERVRNETLVETVGLLKGFPENLSDINLGIRDFFQLTPQQRGMVRERALPPERREFDVLRRRVGTEDIRRRAFAGEEERIRKAIVQLGFIRRQAEASGVTVPREQLMSITESVVAGGKPIEGVKLAVQKGIKSDTAAMVTGINDLVDAADPTKAAARARMEANNLGKSIGKNIQFLQDPRSIDRLNAAFGMDYLEVELKAQFDRLAKLRNYHEGKGNDSVVRAIDDIMTNSSRDLIQAVGVRGAAGIVSPGGIPTPQRLITKGARTLREPKDLIEYLPGEFTLGNLISRALGGEGLREFRQRIEETAGAVTKQEKERAKLIRTVTPIVNPIAGFVGERMAAGVEAGRYGRLKESPEFKKLSGLMDDQVKISVTNSRTLVKLFAAYGAFNTIAKRAAEREQKAYQIQIDQLKQQRSGVVVKYRAGEIEKSDFNAQIKEINSQVIDLVRKSKEAAATAQERATREAVGTIAGVGTAFARAMGVSEKALEGLGGTAAASIIAWNAWTALTGEKLPDAVEKATNATKKWAETLGEEGITWLDKVRIWLARNSTIVSKYAPGVFGAAGKAAAAAKEAEDADKAQKSMFTEQEKEKIKRLKDYESGNENVKKADELLNSVKKGDVKKLGKDEQMLKVSNDQLTTLLSIEENTRQTAEEAGEGTEESKTDKTEKPIKSMTKELRSKLDELKQERIARGGDTATRLKDLMAAAVLVASSGYLGGRGQLGAELGEATRRAEKINSAFEDLVNRFPGELESLIQEMQTRRAEMVEAAGAGGVEKVTKSLLLDTSKLYDEFLNKLLELAEAARSDATKSGEIIDEAKDKMYLKQTAFEIAASIEDFAKTIIDASIDLETGMRLRTETIGAMKGLPTFEEINMGKLPHELTATERLMKEGGPAWQNMYKTFKNLDNVRENLIGLVQTQAKGIVGTQMGLWAETLDEQEIIEGERKSIEGISKKLIAKADPKLDKAIIRMREIAENFNKSLDVGSISGEIKSKESDLRMLKSDSQRLSARYKEAIKLPKMTKIDEAFKEFVGASQFQQLEPKKAERAEMLSSVQALAGVNKKIIATKQQITSLKELETELGGSKLGKAAGELKTKITETMEKLRMQVDVYKDLEGAAKTVTTLMEQLHEVLATGLNVQQLIGDFERMKASFTLDELQQQFVEAADVFEQIRRGGSAPNAPVWPTFEMAQAGMSPEQMATATRRDAALAAIVAQGRMPTGEDLQRIEFDERLRENQYKQAKEDDKLNRQRSAATELHRRILEAQQRAGMMDSELDSEMRKKLISRFEEIRTNLIKQASIAGEKREEIAPGVWERYGYDFGSIESDLAKIGEDFGKKGADLVSGIGGVDDILSRLGLGEYSPVVDKLVEANSYLEVIAKNTGATPEMIKTIQDSLKPLNIPKVTELKDIFQGGSAGKLSGAGGGFGPSFFSKLLESALVRHPLIAPFMAIFGDKTKSKGGFQIGGTIIGPGGPRDDRVPIMASPGEFVVKASSAQKLGKPTLEYMNQTGRVPGFQDGGAVYKPGSYTAKKTPQDIMRERLEKKKAAGEYGPTPFEKSMAYLYPKMQESMPWLPWEETPPEWAKKHPNIYGVAGAIKTFTPALEVESSLQGSEMAFLSLLGLYGLSRGKLLAKGAKNIVTGGYGLIKKSVKGLGGLKEAALYKSESIAGKTAAKPAAKLAKQEEAILATIRLNRQYKEIAEVVMNTEKGATNLGYALGARAAEQPNILRFMIKVDKWLKSGYEAAMDAGNFDQAAQIGAKLQGLREGREFAKVILAVKSGKEAPVTSATPAALKYLEEGSLSNLPTLGFASGGTITGPGGPKEDKVPIMASPGEFVVKASSAQKLGKSSLEYMNQTGRVPGFADGGFIFGKAAEIMKKSAEFYTENRLKLAKENADMLFKKDKSFMDYVKLPLKTLRNVGEMAVSGVAEIGLKLAKSPIELLSGVEQVSYAAGMGTLDDKAKAIAGALYNMEWKDVKGMASSIGTSMVEDLKKGGTGITAGVLEALVPTGVISAGLSKVKDTGRVAKIVSKVLPKHKKLGKSLIKQDAPLTKDVGYVGKAVAKATKMDISKSKDINILGNPPVADNIAAQIKMAMKSDVVSKKELEELIERASIIKQASERFVKGINSIPGLEKVSVTRAGVSKALAGASARDLPESMKALDEIVEQFEAVTKVVGAKNLKLTHVTVGDLTKIDPELKGVPAIFSSDKKFGAVEFSERLFETPRDARARIAAQSKKGNIAFLANAKEEAFKYLVSHELGHSFTKLAKHKVAKKLVLYATKFYDKYKGEIPLIQRFPETDRVSKYSLEGGPKELSAEMFASALHTPRKHAQIPVKSVKDELGIGFSNGGFVNTIDWWKDTLEPYMEGGKGLAEFLKGKGQEFMERFTSDNVPKKALSGKLTKERVEAALGEPLGMGGMIRRKYPEGGIVEDLKGLWEKVVGRASSEGEMVSAPEAIRRVKEREEKIKESVESKGMGGMIRHKYQEGGWVSSLWESIFGRAEAEGETASALESIRRIKEREKEIKEAVEEKQDGGFLDPTKWWKLLKEKLTSRTPEEMSPAEKAIKGILTKERVEAAIGEPLTSYAKGTPFVPETQLAMVHQGEAIIPAEYNMGGFVGAPKFQAGGAVNPLKVVEDAGERIGEAIVKKIEEADITLNVPESSDLPALEIGNLDELRTILEGGAVGADRTSKLDQFIDSATNKLDRLEDQTIDNAERITMVESQTSGIIEIGDLKLSISDLESKVADVYTVIENKIDSDRGKSYMEARLHEVIADLKTEDILPIKSNIRRVELVIEDLARDINNQYDILYSNINRMDLK